MSNSTDFKKQIEANLLSFHSNDLRKNALQLFQTLGYKSDKRIDFEPNTKEGFKIFLKENGTQIQNEAKAHLDEWRTIDFLFQLTDEEISQYKSLFDSSRIDVSDTRIESYLFFAIQLKKAEYRRSELAEITRELNLTFPMPVIILFQHGNTLTFSIIDRRLHKRDESKDVLQKVTLIKDIRFENPHRAHTEILCDLALDNLNVKNFVELHHAWQNTLNISNLNKKFYKRIVEWFNKAITEIKLPDLKPKSEIHKDFTIRLIARIIFVWFLKELNVVDNKLLVPIRNSLIKPNKKESAYYKFILQNLFFNALNKEQIERDDFFSDFDIYASYFDEPDEIRQFEMVKFK